MKYIEKSKHVKSELSGPQEGGQRYCNIYSIKSSNFENAAHDEPFAILLVNELVQSWQKHCNVENRRIRELEIKPLRKINTTANQLEFWSSIVLMRCIRSPQKKLQLHNMQCNVRAPYNMCSLLNLSLIFIDFICWLLTLSRPWSPFLDNVQSEENRLERILWCVCGVGSELGMVVGSKPNRKCFFGQICRIKWIKHLVGWFNCET